MNEIIYLVEATAYTGSTEETFRFCTGVGYTTTPTDTPANMHYEPRVEHPGLYRQDMFSPGATSGSSTGGYGEIVLINTDGGLDSFVDYGFDGRRCVVKQGYAGNALSEFVTVITGTVEQCEVSWNRVTLRLKDRTVELQVPFQSTFYTGANLLPAGIEGTSELRDKPKPRLFGKCNNVSPVMVNTSKLIYQVADNALASITAVYDNGVMLTAGATAYTDQADMEANAPNAGEYRVWLAGGCFRLGSSPAGTITVDAVQGATAANCTAGQIIKQIVLEKLGADQIVEQSIINLDKQAPYVVGYYTGPNSVDVTAILDSLCASVGAWWGFDNSGLFWSNQLTQPDANQSLMTLTEDEILSLDRTATADSSKGVPSYKINIDFSKNWTVQTSGLAGSISQNQLLFEKDDGQQLSTDRRNLLGMEYIRTSATDTSVQIKHLLSPEINVQTTIDTLNDANTEAARLLSLRKVRRDRLNVKVPMHAIKFPPDGIWDTEYVTEVAGTQFIFVYDHYAYFVKTLYSWNYKDSGLYRIDLGKPNSPPEYVSGFAINGSPACHCLIGNIHYVIYGYTAGPPSYISSTMMWHLDMNNASAGYQYGGMLVNNYLGINLYWASCVAIDNFIYVIGGLPTSTKTVRIDINGFIENESAISDLPEPRYGHSSFVYGGYIYVVGGTNGTAEYKAPTLRIPTNALTSSWEVLPPVNSYAILSGFVLRNNIAYLIGGSNGTPDEQLSMRYFNLDNVNEGWKTKSVMLPDALLANTTAKLAILYNNSIFVFTENSSEYSTLKLLENDNGDDANNYANQLTSLGRTVTVKYPRYGYDSGRPMKIIGVESDHSTRIINLELWG
jgi:hypothetical protein